MAQTSPVMEWRANASPFGTIASVSVTGSGYNGAVPTGTTSSVTTVRLYNNFNNAANVADAVNCKIACYDDTVHQGVGINPSTTGLYVQVQVNNYNGTTANADSAWYPIGSATKHPIPTNSGTIGGSGTNYVTISLQVVVPANATQGQVVQGVWLEYSSTA